MAKMNTDPLILALCCHYCAYTAADQAGSQRLDYPTNVKIVRLPCSGKIDALHILRAFEMGADGVYVAGCLEGDCHFSNGNIRASHKVDYAKAQLAEIGVGAERLEMFYMSAGMGERFAQTAREFTDKIRALGASPIKVPAAAGTRAPL